MSIQPNFYRATFRPSADMVEMRTLSTDQGYQIVAGKCPDGELRAQSILFPKQKYSLAHGALRAQSILFPKQKYSLAQATISANLLENIWM